MAWGSSASNEAWALLSPLRVKPSISSGSCPVGRSCAFMKNDAIDVAEWCLIDANLE